MPIINDCLNCKKKKNISDNWKNCKLKCSYKYKKQEEDEIFQLEQQLQRLKKENEVLKEKLNNTLDKQNKYMDKYNQMLGDYNQLKYEWADVNKVIKKANW